MISLEKLKILTALQKLPKNVGVLGNKLLPKALKSYPKSNKLPDLVTLDGSNLTTKVGRDQWPDWAIYSTLGYFLNPLAPINLPKSPHS